jgi:uncharacterized protein (DUF2147 family)
MNVMQLMLAAASALASTSAAGVSGLWMNPDNSVQVDVQSCGEGICGRVVWASPEARADARAGGTPNLVGTEVLRDYRPIAPGEWKGQVFLPDEGRTFRSKMVQLGPGALRISGCEVEGLLCKAQTWHRPGGESSN